MRAWSTSARLRSAPRGLILATALATLTIMVSPASASAEPPIHDEPPTITPEDIVFKHQTLRTGSPTQVGLDPDLIERMPADAATYLEPTPDHPTFPTYAGAVVLAAKDGVIVQHAAVGYAMRYSGTRVENGQTIGIELPRDQWVPMREDTIFDMASVSKLFTTVVALQLVEEGLLDLDAPVASYIPEFAQNGKQDVTVRQLMTHTSGLPAWINLYSQYDTIEERIQAVYATPLAAGASPGNQYVYSDLGLITLGKIAEKITGRALDQLVAERITGPLGMTDTMYNPPASLHHRIAATEEQPWAGRPMIRGEVHDENAWALGGVAGHAGIFSTASDLAIFCQMLLNGGRYGHTRILREESVRAALVNYNAHLEARYPESDRGLGFELHKHWYMGPLASPVGFGHTGYTGTSLVIDPISRSFVIFLSNRVHPSRDWGSNNPARRAMVYDMGLAMPVKPAAGRTAWRAAFADQTTSQLTAALAEPAREAVLTFSLWYDTETRYDVARLQVSTDGGQTWSFLPVTLTARGHRWASDGEFTGYAGRTWAHARAALPEGATHVRWSYTTDSNSLGRGFYVDRILVTGPDGVLLNSESPRWAEAFDPQGFERASS